MTITVAVTGGIGAGKSTVSGMLAARGGIVVDSDRLAREVVGVGTPGLAAVVDRFGAGMIADDGSLDRATLAGVVFADASARRALEDITHPLVRARFAQLQAAAPPGSVVVNDIPLLTTRSAAAAFHLVIGVGAPETVRIERLVGRGLTAEDAGARIAAQIDDEQRKLLCDVWIDNSSGPADARRQADLIWSRLSAYSANGLAGRGAVRPGPRLVAYDPRWPQQAARLADRIRYLVGEHRVDHIGSTAVPGMPAKDVIDLQLTVESPQQGVELGPVLAAGGFPQLIGIDRDNPHPEQAGRIDVDHWRKTLHVNADPGRSVNLHLRVRDTSGWRWALCFRDWMRADDAARAAYLAVKQRAAAGHASDPDVAGYADAKEPFLAAADEPMRSWADSVGWQPS